MKTLIIDNYDSYTFNLYQRIADVNGELPFVVRNDQLDWCELKKLAFDNVVISPGPGRPEKEKDFGICRQLLLEADLPILGVCLGHQGLGYLYGGKVVHAPEVMHGRLSEIDHNESALFKGIPQSSPCVRYHSLIVSDELPDCLEKIAWTSDGLVMGLQHRSRPLWGVQFHPESICTEYGPQLLKNFRDITSRFIRERWEERCSGFGTRDSQTREKGSVSNSSPEPRKTNRFRAQRTPNPEPRSSPEPCSSLLPPEFEVYSRKLEIYPDTEQVFVQLFGKESVAFWLDSSRAEPGLSRYSFMGGSRGPNSILVRYNTQTKDLRVTHRGETTRFKESIFDYLNREINRRRCVSDELPFDFNCGFVGYFGYELKAECGSELVHPSPFPDAIFLLADQILVFDHQEQTTDLVHLSKKGQTAPAEAWFESMEQRLRTLQSSNQAIKQAGNQASRQSSKQAIKQAGKQAMPITNHQSPSTTFRLSRPEGVYIENIRQCQHEITEGESYEICLTNQISTDINPDALTLYRTLRSINPAPYSAFLRFDDLAIVSSSPERFLKIDRDGWVESKPIKGTLARGKTPEEDDAFREQLRNSTKDRAENLMIVDLLRNDLGRVCEVGSIHVPKLMAVETYATVHQLVSTIRGRLRSDTNAVDCVRAAFPGGSMTGAPKIRTMEIIDKIEEEARGVYSGAIGFLGLNGATDLNIVIRTLVITPTQTSIGAGGAIVSLSDPQTEYEEMLLKAEALIRAVLITTDGHVDPKRYQIK